MTDIEIHQLLENVSNQCNDAIDTLIPLRQADVTRKKKLSYIVKKLEIIVGSCNRALDKLETDV